MQSQICLNIEDFFSILNTILSTLDIDELLTTVVRQIRQTIGADRCTLYLIDKDTNELYSKVLQADNLVEIRVPIKKSSLAGYTAITGTLLNIHDAYDDAELCSIDPDLMFDKSWDQKSGYRTRSVLVVPVPFRSKTNLIGVLQALNKPGGFSQTDVDTVYQLSFLLGIAVNNALLYQSIQEEKKFREYIIDDIEEGICILNIKRQILSANRFLEVMSGMRYTVDDLIGQNIYDVFPSFIGSSLEEKINDVFANGIKKIATLAVLSVKVIPYHDEKGKVRRVILIFTRLS